VITVIEAVLQLAAKVLPLSGDHAFDVGHRAPRRFFAEDMETPLQASYGDIGGGIVRQADEQYIKVTLKQLLESVEIINPVPTNWCLVKLDVRYRNHSGVG
jgi:hypothetical protein